MQTVSFSAAVTATPRFLEGSVQPHWVMCSNKGCRCRKGHKHGPYFYRMWRVNGRIRKKYVKAEELEEVLAACAARRRHEAETRISKEEWRRLNAALKEMETLWTEMP